MMKWYHLSPEAANSSLSGGAVSWRQNVARVRPDVLENVLRGRACIIAYCTKILLICIYASLTPPVPPVHAEQAKGKA